MLTFELENFEASHKRKYSFHFFPTADREGPDGCQEVPG